MNTGHWETAMLESVCCASRRDDLCCCRPHPKVRERESETLNGTHTIEFDIWIRLLRNIVKSNEVNDKDCDSESSLSNYQSLQFWCKSKVYLPKSCAHPDSSSGHAYRHWKKGTLFGTKKGVLEAWQHGLQLFMFMLIRCFFEFGTPVSFQTLIQCKGGTN